MGFGVLVIIFSAGGRPMQLGLPFKHEGSKE